MLSIPDPPASCPEVEAILTRIHANRWTREAIRRIQATAGDEQALHVARIMESKYIPTDETAWTVSPINE